jgi:serine/threonine protein kinase
MPLSPGSRLGPYEITAPLGAGGMGEVWRARDTKLNRSVAIKSLPAGFDQDSGRMALLNCWTSDWDGRFLFIARDRSDDQSQVVVVLNWLTELTSHGGTAIE